MLKQIVNSTYYSSEDIANVLTQSIAISDAFVATEFADVSDRNTQEGEITELHIRMAATSRGTGLSAFDGKQPYVIHYEYVPDGTRVVLSVQRRTQICENELEQIAMMTDETPALPLHLVARLFVQFSFIRHAKTIRRHNCKVLTPEKNMKQWMDKIGPLIPADLQIRINTRVDKGSKKAARIVLLKDRIRRRAASLTHNRFLLTRYEEKVKFYADRAVKMESSNLKDLTELSELEEE